MKKMNDTLEKNSMLLKIILFSLVVLGSFSYVIALDIDDWNDFDPQRYAIYGADDYWTYGSRAEFLNISGSLFRPSNTFWTGNMKNIIKVSDDPYELAQDYCSADIDPSLPLAGFNKAYLNGGIRYAATYDVVYRAGVYYYGAGGGDLIMTLYNGGKHKNDGSSWGCDTWGISSDITWNCGFTERRVPIAYAAAQVFTLYNGYGVDKVSGILSNLSVSPDSLTAYPYTSPTHIMLDYEGNIKKGVYLGWSAGVKYIAIAGGHHSRNADWRDDHILHLNITQSKEYRISSRPLYKSEIRSHFTKNFFESEPTMCGLVGQHITSLGFAGELGHIKCCGTYADVGKNNTQYMCRWNTTIDQYYWDSVCGKTWAVGTPEYNINLTYCSACSTTDTGKCSGQLSLHCNGTYTCHQNYNEGDCEAVSGCDWKPTTEIICRDLYDQYGARTPIARDSEPVSGEQFESAIPQDCYEVEKIPSSGSCVAASGIDTPRDCTYVSLSTCNDINGCYLKDSQNSYHDKTDTCAMYSYSMNDCNIRDECNWGCKANVGETCNINADCMIKDSAQLQCDPDFNGVKRCHVTDNRCVVNITGGETSINEYVCQEGQYKRCSETTSTNITYSDYCTTTAGFACAGIPATQACAGSISCYDFGPTACKTTSGCTWKHDLECIGGTFVGCTLYEYPCDTSPTEPIGPTIPAYKGLELNDYAIENGESFGAPTVNDRVNSASFTADIDDCCLETGNVPCSYISTETECNTHSACDWAYGDYYCTGTVLCSKFTVSTCGYGCSVFPYFTSCSGVPYANCSSYYTSGQYLTTGCSRSCLIPKFAAAVNTNLITADNTVNSAACECAGKSIVTCYPDNDGDGFAVNIAPVTRCAVGADSLEYPGYICNYTGLWDCDDADSPTGRVVRPNFGSNQTIVHIANDSDLRAACACTNRVGYDCFVDYDDDGVPGRNPFSYACVHGFDVGDFIDNVTYNGNIKYNVSYVCNYTGGAFDCNDRNASLIDNCPSPCTGFIPYSQRTGFTESPSLYYVPASGPITYVCNGSGMYDIVSNDVAAVNDGINIPTTYVSPLMNNSDMLSDMMFFDAKISNAGYTTPICAVTASVDKFCQLQGYSAGSVTIISSAPESCISWNGAAWINSTGMVGNVNCTFLPVCSNGPSITQYCNEKGYDGGSAFGTPTTKRCLDWTGSAWNIINSGVSGINCYYYPDGEFDMIAFTLDGTPYDYTKCVRDGVCMDDFTSTPICGAAAAKTFTSPQIPQIGLLCNNTASVNKFCDFLGYTTGGRLLTTNVTSNTCYTWNGLNWASVTAKAASQITCTNTTDPLLHLDPDCGIHTWMKGGAVRVPQGVDLVSVYPFVTPSPIIHRECVDNTDCVYNTSQGYLCYDNGTVVDTGRISPADPIQRATIKVNCSNSNTWCPFGYRFEDGICVLARNPDCTISACPQVLNFTVYDEGILVNRVYFVEESIASAENILGTGPVLTEAYYKQYRDRFFNNTNCSMRTGTKISGVCGVMLTFPELKYEYKNVVVK